jgi:hypothetical protein
MGMYDYISSKYPLPRPTDPMEAKDVNFTALTFQTKDLECALDNYEIREDGTLWQRQYEIEWEAGDPKADSLSERIGRIGRSKLVKEWWVPYHYSGNMEFYEALQHSDQSNELWKNDYWVEYQARFDKGQLVDVQLVKFDATSNAERLQTQKEMFEQMNAHAKLWNKWYMKYGYRFYDSFIHWLFHKWYRFKQLLLKLPPAWKVEQWLRPL